MNAQAHWEKIYQSKSADAVSWYRPHLESSLTLIKRTVSPDASIIDVGGGASTLVDDLLVQGFENITVLDISQTALAAAKKRLGTLAEKVLWLCADVTQADLPLHAYDLWHDRAVFHFLVLPEQRAAYVQAVEHSVKPGGHVIVSTFGPDGPTKCSGLDVVRYNAASLHDQFGNRFHLVENFLETHQTPSGATQQFLYCYFRLE